MTFSLRSARDRLTGRQEVPPLASDAAPAVLVRPDPVAAAAAAALFNALDWHTAGCRCRSHRPSDRVMPQA